MSERRNIDERTLLAEGADLIEREAAAIDERRWDEWLALFTADCEYWMPAWKSDDTLTSDPRAELSHFYYASRAGLEDRIYRIRSNRSPASTPLPRTTHIIANTRLIEPAAPDRLKLRCNWASHVFFPRSQESHAFFGHTEHTLVAADTGWLIAKKRIVLQNDYIPTMLDIYCV
ncbi:MAG TPA: aromatic-ring-hydroxylating dioxygenase subunit beta [Stellaceae bacterium]|nr:aromatic-ring-hydroxylating dioxygenase subunit beta [Stellaceae bacterium]